MNKAEIKLESIKEVLEMPEFSHVAESSPQFAQTTNTNADTKKKKRRR